MVLKSTCRLSISSWRLGRVSCKVAVAKKHAGARSQEAPTNASAMKGRNVVQALQRGEPGHPGI
jgi:hypothetical protein